MNKHFLGKWVGFALMAVALIISLFIDFAGNYFFWYMPVMQVVGIGSLYFASAFYYGTNPLDAKLWHFILGFAICFLLVFFSSFPAYDGKW